LKIYAKFRSYTHVTVFGTKSYLREQENVKIYNTKREGTHPLVARKDPYYPPMAKKQPLNIQYKTN